MANVDITKAELVWNGKYSENGTRKEVPRINLPFQVIETINESRITKETEKLKQLTLFDIWKGDDGQTFESGWRNKLIWGDNLLLMSSLLENFSGKIDLIYIDPPFATGADFSFTSQIGDEELNVFKEQSIIEEKAYRDTWGRGLDSYLQMMESRLVILKELLSERGTIFVHIDVHMGPYIKVLMDELFGRENFLNQIAWYYYNKMHDSRKSILPKSYDIILWYAKNRAVKHAYHHLEEKRDTPVKQLKRAKINGKMVNVKDENGHVIYQEKDSRLIDNIWRIRCLQPANLSEWTGFETQKPVDLIERILTMASNPNDLIFDAFVGSGSTAIAAERLGRRWIACDISRWSIHLTRKRLLEIEECKPFEILNLGKYERQLWQGLTFGESTQNLTERSIFEYLAFILKLYGAQPVAGLMHLHGKKGRAMVHIGSVDAPVTIDEISAAIDECIKLRQPELHVLGWEWEMGLAGPNNDYKKGSLMHDVAKQKGVKLILLQIPRDVMDEQAVNQGDIQFFELAYLDVEIARPKKLTVAVLLKDFVIPNTELIPEEVKEKVSKWSDYIDYWAVDWDFRNDTFLQGWVTYRTRKDRSLSLKSDKHTYEKPGKYRILLKVVDIFGNDTSQAYDVQVV